MASFTKEDSIHAVRYAQPRQLLHDLQRVSILYPQIFSHVVVEIYAANPKIDYRFDRQFADHAILVKCRWASSGKGCTNSTCYSTYPRGKMCDDTTPPTVFVTGNGQNVAACQPACFMRQRAGQLLRRQATATNNQTGSVFVDDTDPARCVECDSLNPLITDHVMRRRVDGDYDLWLRDYLNKKFHEVPKDALPSGFHTRDAKEVDGLPSVRVDAGFTRWNRQHSRCEQIVDQLYRQVVEPYWRDASHSVCRLTNFRIGEQVVEGYSSANAKYIENKEVKKADILGYLQRNSPTYCRAFDKEWSSEDGNCVLPWWEQALVYTVLGEGIIRILRNTVNGQSGCEADAWVPTEEEIAQWSKPDAEPNDTRTLRDWRSDVNLSYTLPPPNVTMLDLGIDVLVTGNRLYWNNVEGIISHMPLFETVDTLKQRKRDLYENEDDWRSIYRNYNDYEPPPNDDTSSNESTWYDPSSSTNSSVYQRPSVLQRLEERMLSLVSDVDAKLNGDELHGTFTEEDAKHFVDLIVNTLDENLLLVIARDLGLAVTVETVRQLLGSLMKKAYRRLVQYVARNLAGRVAGTLMRTGLRIGLSRVIGAAISTLSTRLLLIAGAASSGVGVLISAIEILSLVIDLALMFGWDPGNYNAQTSTESFRYLMDSSFAALYSQRSYEVRVDEYAFFLLSSSNDTTDLDTMTLSRGTGGTANASLPNTGSLSKTEFNEYDSNDSMVRIPRWFNKMWLQCFQKSDVIVAGQQQQQQLQHLRRKKRETISSSTQRELLSPRLPLENDRQLWTTLLDLQYLGALRTNSYGQLVNLPEQTSDLDDASIVDLIEQSDYRELGTISVNRNVDATTYNQRNRYYSASSTVLTTAGLLSIFFSSLVTSKLLLVFGFVVCGIGLLVAVVGTYLPVDEKLIDYTTNDDGTIAQSNTKLRYNDIIRDELSLTSMIAGVRRFFTSLSAAIV